MIKRVLFFLVTVLVLVGSDRVWAERMSVKADIANVRAEPDTNAAVIWQIEKHHPLTVIRKQGPWYLFEDFEGDRGWIHSSLLSDVTSVIVKRDNCNVRAGPGTDSDIRFTVDKGVPFRVQAEKAEWLHLVHADGDQGWIHRSLVW
ncbi:MAG: SH3 domain-containing protein [Desulfosarcina sp.]